MSYTQQDGVLASSLHEAKVPLPLKKCQVKIQPEELKQENGLVTMYVIGKIKSTIQVVHVCEKRD